MKRTKAWIVWAAAALLLLGAAAAVWWISATTARGVNTDVFGVAIKGYDAVAYFTEQRAVRGSARFAWKWDDAYWHFSSAEHRNLFAGDPERYAPQYGGFCASFLAEGGVAGVDPEAWAIVDGKLYLNWSRQGRDAFVAEASDKIRRADREWATLQGVR